MKICVIVLLAVLAYIPAQTQEPTEFVFDVNPGALDISDFDGQQIKSNPMGNEVATKLSLLQSRFTYTEEGTPTSPTNRTIIIKPTIYNSVLKLNRYYKKQVKKGTKELGPATSEFLKYIDLALILYAERTEEFEDYLNKAGSAEEIIAAYDLIELR